jgi:hypothetical protein
MLCVLMLRHMPWEYDRYAARLPPMEAMRHLWHLEGVEGVKWRDATARTDRLSDSLKDLLDKMLEAEEAKRLSLEEVGALGTGARGSGGERGQAADMGTTLTRCTCVETSRCSAGSWGDKTPHCTLLQAAAWCQPARRLSMPMPANP